MRVLLALLTLIAGMAAAGIGRAQIVLLSEDFDGITPPAPPAGWTLDAGWETSTGVASPGSGLNNLMSSGSPAGSAVMPSVDLTGAAFATLTYLARRSGTYDVGNLRVTASLDGGATFSITILASGTAIPATGTGYETISVALPSTLLGAADVVIRFEGQGLSPSGSNARIDDVTLEMYAEGEAAGGTFGFVVAAGAAVAGDDSIAVPLRLAFSAPPGLQGLQFRVSWSLDSLRLVDVVAGDAVSDEEAWSLSFEAGTHDADVVLLGEGITALPSGTYDGLLTLRFAAGATESELVDLLTLSNLVAALATPEGGDAGITIGTGAFSLSVAPGAAVFFASPPLLDLGTVDVGQADSAVVTVSNPGGTKDMEIAAVSSTNPLFTVGPGSGVIAPDDSLHFIVTFAPVDTAFGLQEAELHFLHGDSVGMIPIIGKGRGGRGDAEGDGSVDVLDIVHAIDFVLARISPGPAQTAAADLFPFPDGDGELDVRDLTVLSQAVARGQWPDGLLLPVEAALAATSAAGAAHVALLSGGAGGYTLELRHDVPIRAFQLIFPAASPYAAVTGVTGMALRSGFDEARGELRIVGYVVDGGAMEPGVRRIDLSAPVGPPRYATVIGKDLRRIDVDSRIPTLAEGEALPAVHVGSPYPNPFPASSAVLRIPHVPSRGEVEVYNLLGRKVLGTRVEGSEFEWNGRDASGRQVAPGLYITRLRADGIQRTWTVIVLP